MFFPDFLRGYERGTNNLVIFGRAGKNIADENMNNIMLLTAEIVDIHFLLNN